MKLSVSDLLPFLTCEYAGQVRLQENAWDPRSSAALNIGSALHEHMAWILGGRKGPAPSCDLSTAEDLKIYESCVNAVVDWSPPWEIKGVELALSAPLPFSSATIQGRLDGWANDGRDWSVQWKSVGRGTDIGNVIEKVRMSPHELIYHWLCREQLGIELAGTIVGTFKKTLTKAEVEQGVPVFQLWELHRTTEEVDRALQQDLFPLFRRVVGSQIHPDAPRNWTSCFGTFGNYKCPLFDHCHHGLPIGVVGLAPLEDRYGSESALSA